MEYSQLQYFQVVAEEGSLSAAAQRLFVSQPALSRSIARLEEELGLKLFDRTSNRIVLNDIGKLFLKYVIQSQMELESGVKCIREMSNKETGYISIATSSHGVIADLTGRYLVKHPRVHFMQYILTEKQMTDMLQKRKLDFCLSYNQFHNGNILWEPIMMDAFVLYVNSNHPFARKKTVDISELQGERIILYDYGLETADAFLSMCHNANFEPDLFFAGNENEVPFYLMNHNLGVFLLPASMHYFHNAYLLGQPPRPEAQDCTVLLTPMSLNNMTCGIATLKDRSLSLTAQDFRDAVTEEMRTRHNMVQERLREDFRAIIV